jgi:hypothetical protein
MKRTLICGCRKISDFSKTKNMTSWELAVYRLINWFKEPQNHDLAKKYFGRLSTEKDFPQECPYTFEQVMEHEPWV